MDYESEVDESIQAYSCIDLDEEDAEVIPSAEDGAVVVLGERPADRTQDGTAKKINFVRRSNLWYTMIEKNEIGKFDGFHVEKGGYSFSNLRGRGW